MDRLFFDAEVTGSTDDAKFISIGLVDESGRHTFYAELADTWQLAEVGEFALREVIPQLEGGASSLSVHTLQERLTVWISALRVPVMLATDSLQWHWPWIVGCCRFRGHQPKLLKLPQTVSDLRTPASNAGA